MMYPPSFTKYSVSDSPTGPWTFGKVIMEDTGGNCGTNHPGIADYKGKTYLTYHDGNLPGGGVQVPGPGIIPKAFP